MANKHHAHPIHSLKELLEHRSKAFDMSTGLTVKMELTPREKRRLIKMWKEHVAKHGNVPMIFKCSVCSGEEHKRDIKHGRYKISSKEDKAKKRDDD